MDWPGPMFAARDEHALFRAKPASYASRRPLQRDLIVILRNSGTPLARKKRDPRVYMAWSRSSARG